MSSSLAKPTPHVLSVTSSVYLSAALLSGVNSSPQGILPFEKLRKRVSKCCPEAWKVGRSAGVGVNRGMILGLLRQRARDSDLLYLYQNLMKRSWCSGEDNAVLGYFQADKK